MNKIIAGAILIVFPILGFSQTDSTNSDYCNIQTNGIYYAVLDSATNIYVRFHEGDTVVTSSSTNNVKLAFQYINKAMGKEALMGKYFFNENTCNVMVKAKNDFAKVKMSGIVNGSNLVLTVTNKTDNTARDFIFKYYRPKESQ